MKWFEPSAAINELPHDLGLYCQLSFIALCLSVGIWFGMGWIKQVLHTFWTVVTHLCVLIVVLALLLAQPTLFEYWKHAVESTLQLVKTATAIPK